MAQHLVDTDLEDAVGGDVLLFGWEGMVFGVGCIELVGVVGRGGWLWGGRGEGGVELVLVCLEEGGVEGLLWEVVKVEFSRFFT